MNGRTLWIAIVLAALCLFAPGAAVLADDAQVPPGFLIELLDWLASFIASPDAAPPDSLGAQPPAVIEPEVSILIPPGG